MNFESLSSLMSNAMGFITPIIMAVMAILVITMIWKRNWMGVIAIMGVGAVGAILLFYWEPTFKEGVSSEKAPPPPTVTETPGPVTENAIDFDILWITLAIIGGVLVLGILIVLLVTAAKRARHSALDLKEKQRAVAADKAKALAVWGKSTARHSELKTKVLEIETDWDMLFSFPALMDMSVPQTAAFHRALKAADDASNEPPADLNLTMNIAELPYPKLVSQADEAWERAWAFAKHVGLKLIPRDERKKIEQIIKLLEITRRSGGSEHERNLAYERVAKLVKEVHFVRVPAKALQALTAESRLMLEASQEDTRPQSREKDRVFTL